MTLAPGARVGGYEIVGPLGAGGMGEVYRARDSQLGRIVALKVLPAAFAADPDRRARFEREARTLATLNHPYIAQIYGLEQQTPDAVRSAVLVMEYVEGEDLSDVMKRGPIPTAVAVPIARQIAEALEAAHEQGIAHRDLKPENIKVRQDGTVKVLDFGLAKVLDPSPAASADLRNSPTLSARATEVGSLLGTAAYMAPEQARGRALDKRVDIWAFGVILFEMLTGRALFSGETTTEVLAAVLTQKVPWDRLPARTPLHVHRLLRRCLQPDPRERLRDIGEARIALEERSEGALLEPGAVPSAPPRASRLRVWAIGATALALGSLATAAALVSWDSPPALGPLRFGIDVPQAFGLTRPGVNPVLAVSPDGRRIAFAAARAIWVWSAETGKVRRLDDTAGARAPFFSPDGREIGFFTADELRRVSVDGGPATTVAPASGGGAGAWAADGNVLYHRWIGAETGLWRVNVHGGEPQLLMPAAERRELRGAPALLPDGRHYLFTSGHLRVGDRQICAASVDTAEATCFARGDSHVAYSATGHVLFVRRGQLMALGFDPRRQRPTGEPFAVGAPVRWFGPTGVASFAVSSDGRTLVYHPPGNPSRLAWVHRKTRTITPVGEPARYGSVLLSPDQTKVATEIWNDQTEGRDLFIVDLASGVPSRVTAEEIDAVMGGWSRDGRLVFSRAMSTPPDILSMSLDRPGDARLLLSAPGVQIARDWSADGRYIAYVDQYAEREERVQVFLLSADGQTRKFRDLAGDSFDPRFSPDGRWLAYAAIETNRPEIYVAAVDGSGVPRRLSRNGGVLPRWRGDGRELFFVQPDGMVVTVDPTRTLPVPSLLFHVEGAEPNLADYRDSERWFDYDVTSDGQRFLIRQPAAEEPAGSLRVVIDWLPRR